MSNHVAPGNHLTSIAREAAESDHRLPITCEKITSTDEFSESHIEQTSHLLSI